MKKYIGQHIFDYVASFRQNVGIGTDSPTKKLHVSGNAIITNAAGSEHLLTLHNTTNGGGASINFSDQTNGSQTGTIDFLHQDSVSQGGGASFKISSTESDMVLNVGGRIVATPHSSNSEVDYGFVDDVDTGMMRSGTNAIRLVTGGSAALDITSSQNANFHGDLNVSGNLTVSGTTTTINTTNLNVEDKNITINYSTGDSSSTADGAGITIQDAVDSSNDATLLWDATNDQFDFSHSISLGNNKRIIFNDSSGNDGTSITYDTNTLFKITQANSGELRLNAGFNSNSNNKITFYTQGSSERMRITNDGNVGIGTNSPVHKLVVLGGNIQTDGIVYSNTIRDNTGGNVNIQDNGGNVGIGTASPHNKAHIVSTSSDDGLLIDCSNGSNNNFTGVYFKIDNNTTNAYKKGALVWERTGSYNEGRFHFLLNNEDNVNNVGLSDSKMTILSTGNVGVGVTDPGGLLQVNSYTGSATDGAQSMYAGGLSIFTNSGTTDLFMGVKNASYANRGWSFKTTEVGVNSKLDLVEHGLSGTRLTVLSGGNVGIGTTSPSQALHVKGRTFFDREVGSSGDHIISDFKNTDGTNNPVLRIQSTATGMKIKTGFSTGIPGSFELQSDGGSSYIGFKTNGDNERMRITSGGNLLLGVTSGSTAKLQSISPDGNSSSLRIGRADNSNFWEFNHAGNDLRLYNTASSGSHILLGVDHSGTLKKKKIGIGTALPSQKLDVNGTVRAVAVDINSTFGADNVTFSNTTNDKYEMGSIETKLNAMPFPLDYHDVLSFGRNYTITQEISTDGTNFSSMTLEPDVFNMRTDNSVRVIDGSLSTEEQAVRYIVTNVAYVSAQFLKICFTFSSPAPSVTVTVHTCTDADFESGSGTTTQRHTSTVSGASSKTVYFYLDYHGADSHMRITLDKGNNTDNKNVNVSSLQLLTRRNGDQGQGPEYNLPIDWDYNRNVTIPGSLTVNGADAIVIPDYIIHAGDTDSKFGFPANDNFKVRLSGLDVFTMSNSAMAFTGTMTASSYKISSATVLSGSTNVTLGSAGATGTISLATHTSTPFKIEDDDSITITAGDSVAPEVNLLHDGTNPGTGEQLGVVQFQVDYNGSHQDWGDIELRTTTSATRTKLNFNVKSTSGNILNALTLDGTTDGTTAAFAGPVTSNSLSVATTKNVVLVHGTGGVVGNSGSNSSDSHTWTITHGMGSSRNYKVEVMLNSGNYDTVYPDITRPSDTTIVVTFGAAVANSAYKALILKCE